MADHFSLVMSCIDSVSDRVRGGSSKRWQLNEHQCSYLAEELLKVSQSLQAKLESGNFKPVRGIQKIVLLHLHAAVKRAQLLVERSFCETSSSWRVAAMTSTDIKEEVITIVLNLHQWTSVLDIAIGSVEGRPSKENLEFLKTWGEGYQRLFKKLHSSKHPLQVAALQDHKTLLANIAEYTEDDYAYAVYLKSRLAPMGGEVQSVPQLEDYKVSRALGHGASGMVLEVTWMGHQCGLKISKGSEKTEATILNRLHHPNIVRFFHYWEVPPPDRNSCMVMELLPSDLQRHILRELSRPSSQSHKKCVGMPFLLSVAIDLMLQVAQAMQYVHDQKLTHRDLKTSNILVKPVPESMSELHSQGYLEVKLADFGLAKGYLDSSISGGLTRNMGTTIYGAPEIFGQEETQTHKNFPPKADVWSFGMVCWEILTGRVPFSEESSKAELHKKIRFECLRPSFPKDCPVYLQFCIASCWELQPQRRSNFSDLCRMLRHAHLLNLGLICLEDTGSMFGYSDRAGLVNTMSITSSSSAVDSTKSWFRGGIGLISNFRNIGRRYKPIQPAVEDSNDHTLQPTCEIVLTPGQSDNGNPLPQFKGWRNEGQMEVGRKQARNKEKEEASNAELRNASHEATEKLKEMVERMPQGPFKHGRSASLSLSRLDIPNGAQGSSALDVGSEGSGLQFQQFSPSADNHGSEGNGVVSPSSPLSGRGSQGADSPGIGAEVQSVRPATRLGEGEMSVPYDTGQRQEEGVRTSVTSLSTENGREPESEWVENDEPGVYITLTTLPGGGRDLKRVRFSRKRFSEREAEQWWAENRVRVREQYNVRIEIGTE